MCSFKQCLLLMIVLLGLIFGPIILSSIIALDECEWVEVERMEIVKDGSGYYYVYYNKGNAYFGGSAGTKKVGDGICVYEGKVIK